MYLTELTQAASNNPKLLNYQARITDADDVPVADGSLNVAFAIYSASSGATGCLWSASNTDADTSTIDCAGNTPDGLISVTVKDGVFSVILGDTSAGQNALPDDLFDGDTRYLGITVESDAEMTPRKRITSAPYAFNADRLDDLDTSSTGGTGAYVPVTDSSGNLTITGRGIFADQSGTPTGNIFEVQNNGGSVKYFTVSSTSTTVTGDLTITGTCTGCGGGGASTLQEAYDNSTSPEFTLDATRGALTIRDSSGGIGGNLFEVRDFTQNTDYLTTSSTGTRLGGDDFLLDTVNRIFAIGSTDPLNDDADGTGAIYIQGNGASNLTGLSMYTATSNGLTPTTIGLFSSRGTVDSRTANVDGDRIGVINFAGSDASGFVYGTSVKAEIDAAVSVGVVPTRLVFSTARTSGVLNEAEAMRIDSAGRVLIGNTTGEARLTVADASGTPTGNIFEVWNFGGSSKYLTVSSTSTTITGDLTITGTCTGCGGGGASTLQDAYDGGTGHPHIQLTSTDGPLSIADAGTTIGNLFEVWNNGGSSKYLTVSSTSTIVTGDLSVSGNAIVGDASDDAITFNAGSLFLNNPFNVQASTNQVTFFSDTTATDGSYLFSNGSQSDVNASVVKIESNNNAFEGRLLNLSHIPSNVSADFTGSLFRVFSSRAETDAVTRSDSGDALFLSRSTQVNNAGATYNVTGPVARFRSVGDQTAGTLNDSSNVLLLDQAYSGATGAVLQITNSGTGLDVRGNAGNWSVDKDGNATFVSCTGCGGGGASTLQDAYDGGTGQPHITLTSTDGSFSIADAGTTIGNLFEVWNNGGSSKYLTVSSTNTRIAVGASTPLTVARTTRGEILGIEDGTDDIGMFTSDGTPESSITADRGSIAIDTTNGALYIKTTDGSNTGWSLLDTTTANPDQLAIIADQKAAGTNGGASAGGTVQVRDLNTELYDPNGIVSISANQFTLQPGTYHIVAKVPALRIAEHQAYLYNVTDAQYDLIGTSAWNDAAASDAQTESTVDGVITIASAKVFEIRHFTATTKTINGLGVATSNGEVETYTTVRIQKMQNSGLATPSSRIQDADNNTFIEVEATTDVNQIRFNTETAGEVMRIADNGYVQIGNTTGNARLTVADASGTPTGNIFEVWNFGGSSKYFTVSSTSTNTTGRYFSSEDGTNPAPTYSFANNTNTGMSNNGGSLGLSANGNITFYTNGATRMLLSSTGTLRPNTNDGAILGSSTVGWSDLFLASGGVVDFGAGNFTLTHAPGELTAAGKLIVADVSGTPTGNIFEVWNNGGSEKYFTVSSTSTTVTGDLTVTGTCTGCGASTLQAAYDNDVDGSDVTITTNATDGDIVIAGDQDFRFTSTGNVIFDTTTLFVDTTQNEVGINTATPSQALDVVGRAVFSTQVGIGGAGISNATTLNVQTTGPASNAAWIKSTRAGDSSVAVLNVEGTSATFGSTGFANLQEWTIAGTALSAITRNGSLGVGTATPPARLTVADASGTPTGNIFEVWNFGGSSKYLTVSSTSTTITIGDASGGLLIDNTFTGAADPSLGFQLSGTTQFTMGVRDFSANDDFVIADGSSLNSNPRLTIDGSTGDVTIANNLTITGTCTGCGGGGGGTLQEAYDGGTGQPHIQLTSTDGPFSIADAGTTIGNLFEIWSNGGSSKYLTVSSTNTRIAVGASTPLTVARTTRGEFLALEDGTDDLGMHTSDGSPESSITADRGSLAIDTTNGALYIKTTDGSNTGWSLFDTTTANPDQIAIIADQKAAGTNGGTSAGGTVRVRDLNTELYDPNGIVSISSNQFTLQAGTYHIVAKAPRMRGLHQAYLYNVTDAQYDLTGTSEWNLSGTNSSQTTSTVDGVITITSTKVFEIRQYGSIGVTTIGLGNATNNGEVETYTTVRIRKMQNSSTSSGGSLIQDADANTFIEVEATTDVNQIRFNTETAGEVMRITNEGYVQIGNTTGEARLTVADVSGTPTGNIFEVWNFGGSEKYFTVSSTSTTVTGDLTITGTCTGCGGGGGTLQDAYDGGTGQPHITLTSSDGPLSIADAGTTIGNLFEVWNNGGSSKYLTVSSTSTNLDYNANTSGNAMSISATALTSGSALSVTGGAATGFSGSVVAIVGPTTSTVGNGVGAALDVRMDGNPGATNNAAMVKFTAGSLFAGGTVQSIGTGDLQATGVGLNVTGRTSFTTGSLLKVDKTINAGRSTAHTGSIASFAQSDRYTSGTQDSTGSVIGATRSTTVSGATTTLSGAVVSIVDSLPSVTSGTLAHTSPVLSLQQLGTSNTGSALSITNAGTGSVISATGNSITTATAVNVSATGLTEGTGITITGPTSGLTTGSLLKLTGIGSSSGNATGALIDGVMTSNPQNTNNSAAVSFILNGLTTGQGFHMQMSGMTSGSGMHIFSGSNVMTSGKLMRVRRTGNNTLTAFTGALSEVKLDITQASAGSPNHTGNVLDVTRAFTTSGGSATPTVAGAVVNILDTGTQTSGTLTHTGAVLTLNQDYASASGAVLTIKNSGTGFDIEGNGASWGVDNSGNAFVNLISSGTAALCHPVNGAGSLQQIQDCSGTPAADYMEMYPAAAGLAMGDIVMMGNATVMASNGGQVRQVVKSAQAYEMRLVGVISDPNDVGDFNSIGHNIREKDNPMPVALKGRVRVKVSLENGPIAVGDPVTSASSPGFGMKSTKPGMIVGQALEAWNGPGEGMITVFMGNGWHSGMAIGTDGTIALFEDDFTFDASASADAVATASGSRTLTFRASAWDSDTSTAVTRDITMSNTLTDKGTYDLTFLNNDQETITRMGQSGNLYIAGKLFPSDRGTLQTDKYLFYDGSTGSGGNMMRTNAAGWSTGSYDFAEMFTVREGDVLEAGTIVVADTKHDEGIIASTESYQNTILGIISTRPGFLAGENKEGDMPVALIGRVPTRVNMEGGIINIGDPITSSSEAGVGMKATEAGRVVGIALQKYDGTQTDENGQPTSVITVYVNPSWWNGPGNATGETLSGSALTIETTAGVDFKKSTLTNVGAIIGSSGLWSIGADGRIFARNVEADVVKAKEIILTATNDYATTGEGVIKAGQTTAIVLNPTAHANSRIFVSFLGNPGSAYWVGARREGDFTIHLSAAATSDLPFEYWILNIDDQRTEKVK